MDSIRGADAGGIPQRGRAPGRYVEDVDAANLQDFGIALLGAAAFLYVAQRRPATDIHASVLSLLAFMVVSAGGRLAMGMSSTDLGARIGLYAAYLGSCGMTPCALWFAARFTRSRLVERGPQLVLAASIPCALAFLALVTNDGHRLFSVAPVPPVLRQGALSWAGPVFWIALAWQLALALGALGMFAQYAMRPGTPRQRLHGQAMMLACGLPMMASLAHHLQLFPLSVDPTPLSVGLAVAAVTLIAIRDRLGDVLPLARRDVIETLSDAVILTDLDGNVLDLNPAAARLLSAPEPGTWRGPLLARALARLAPDEAMEGVEQTLESALAARAPVGTTLRTRSGRDLEIHTDSVRRGEGDPSGCFAWIRDVTETRRYERMLRESQQRVIVGGLAAGLAHEVNNPLAFVASNLQQIHRTSTFEASELEPFEKGRAEELAELSEVVAETIEGVSRIADIVGRIIRPGTLSEDDCVGLDLARVIDDAVRLIELHGQYPVGTRVEPIANLPEVEGCPERLSQALLNLLLNAQQACQSVPDAVVTVAANAEDGGVAVRMGIEGGSRARPEGLVAPSSSNAEAELSAAYEIVREHGGSLEAGAPDGALFVVRLPAAD